MRCGTNTRGNLLQHVVMICCLSCTVFMEEHWGSCKIKENWLNTAFKRPAIWQLYGCWQVNSFVPKSWAVQLTIQHHFAIREWQPWLSRFLLCTVGPKKFLYSSNHFMSGCSASFFDCTSTAMTYFIVTCNTQGNTNASDATTISPKTTKTTGGNESAWHHDHIWLMTSEDANRRAEILYFFVEETFLAWQRSSVLL